MTRDLIFLCIHTRLMARVYTKKNQVTRGIFHGDHPTALHQLLRDWQMKASFTIMKHLATKNVEAEEMC